MSSFDRRALIAGGAALLLSGCFRPMLAEDAPASALRGKIALPGVNDRFGFFLHESLEDRLGRPSNPEFRLELRTRLTESGLLVTQDNAVTRIQMTAEADLQLFREGETEPVLTDKVVSQSGFDSTASLYASRTTKRDIEDRLARDLGVRIARRILARAGRLQAAART